VKIISILKNPEAGLSLFAAILFCFIASVSSLSYAQTGQPSSGWGDPGTDRSNSAPAAPTIDSTAPKQGIQTGPSSSGASAEQTSGSCGKYKSDQESFLCMLIRVFYGRDTPRGPNRDVEENIGVGGAAG
jgi:hypothetical protein